MAVLVTGANRGIGRALFDHFRAKGVEIFGTTRRTPEGADWLHLDVTDPDSVAALAEGMRGRCLDLLVCNAGIYLDKSQRLADGYPPDLWAKTFAVNVTGVFLTIQALLPTMTRGSKIAIISSQMASTTLAPGGSYIYRASKAAVLNLGRNIAHDLAPEGIAVGIYHPGWVKTDMGGPSASIAPMDSVEGLARRFDALGPETTGCFETWDGRGHPL